MSRCRPEYNVKLDIMAIATYLLSCDLRPDQEKDNALLIGHLEKMQVNSIDTTSLRLKSVGPLLTRRW